MKTNSSMRGKKVLITGINGFIGVNLAKKLNEMGAEVEGTSRDTRSMSYLREAGLEDNYPIHQMDLRNGIPIYEAITAGNYEYVFHLASQSDTWKSIHGPYETIKTNVIGTLNLLEAIRKIPNKPKTVLAGTVRAFYDHEDEYPGIGLHPYDASKMSMETIATSYFHAYNIPGAVAKNTNVYGENDLNFARLIPIIMKQVFSSNAIRLKGDGKLKRDFMYVGDAVEGMISLATQLEKPTITGRAFTFATGKLMSIREVCKEIQTAVGKEFPIEFDENETLVERNQPVLNVHDTARVLGWESKVSIEKGIQKTTKWYQEYFRRNQK